MPPGKPKRAGASMHAPGGAAQGGPGRPKGAGAPAAAPAPRRRAPLQEVTHLYANSAEPPRRQPSMLAFR